MVERVRHYTPNSG